MESGSATTERLRASDARVAVFDLAASEGDSDLPIAGDVTRSADLDGAVARVVGGFGRLDLLVCCAGVNGDPLRTVAVSDEGWQRVLAVTRTASSSPLGPPEG